MRLGLSMTWYSVLGEMPCESDIPCARTPDGAYASLNSSRGVSRTMDAAKVAMRGRGWIPVGDIPYKRQPLIHVLLRVAE